MPDVLLLPQAERIPVNNIFCIGRNYARHIEELGNSKGEDPVVFLKPTSALLREGEQIRLPDFSSNVHHETEIVILVGKTGRAIPERQALEFVLAYGVGLDLTARDTQESLRAHGLPWAIAKGFDSSACVSAFLRADELPDPSDFRFSLDVNGERRQNGDASRMLFPVPVILSFLSRIFTLHTGDLIFTGTPEGVAPIRSGDALELRLLDRISATFRVA